MTLKFKTLGGLFLLLMVSSSFPGEALANNPVPVNEQFDRAFFKHDPDFYGNNSFGRQIDWLVGPGSIFRNSFPENEIARDAELVNKLYRDAMEQQVGSDPYIRTPDLPNPFNSSLLSSPRLNQNRLRTGTEFRFEAPSR